MAYSHITFAQIKTQLANRLGDAGKVFFADAELGLYLKEALRTWNCAAFQWRAQSSFNTVASTAFYDITTELSSELGFTLKDRDLINDLQYHLLENVNDFSVSSTWAGTEMFTMDDLTRALERRRNQFLLETGLIVTRSTQSVTGSVGTPAARISLSDSIMQIRRLAWLASSVYTHLWREDEFAVTRFSVGALTTAAPKPQSFSVATTPPITLQLIPPSNASGTLEILSINAPAALDPATGVLMNLPDDFCWVIKWGALADLLGGDGQRRDPQRAEYSENRYKEGVELARINMSVMQAQIAGLPTEPQSLLDLDAFNSNWQNTTDAPTTLAMEGYNLLALALIPDNTYSITLDILRKAVVPSSGSDQIDLGREELDAVLDYAAHLACFKMGGAEFEITTPHYERLVRLASIKNEVLRANAKNFDVLTDRSQREEKYRPRREEAAD